MCARQVKTERVQSSPAVCSWHHSVTTERTAEQCRHESRHQLEGLVLYQHTINYSNP